MALHPTLCNGSYRVRFMNQGKRLCVYFGTDDHATATRLCRKLELDLLNGTLQDDLKAYSLKYESSSNPGSAKPVNPGPSKAKAITLIELWDEWLSSLDLPLHTLNGHYHATRQVIPSQALWDDVQWFKDYMGKVTHATIVKRLSLIRACIQWHISQGNIQGINVWHTIKLQSRPGMVSKTVNPFSESEIQAILEAFQTNQFCPKESRFTHSHYLPLVKFLFTYGTRIGECLALTWQDIDFINDVITIDKAVSRDLESSPYASRKIVKDTKTGIVNYLPLVQPIKDMLICLKESSNNPLVFPGHKGNIMDSKRFRLVWKSILDGLGIPYRYPYMARHTVLSNVAKNHGLAAAASLAGHKDLTMVSKHYVKFIGDKKDIIPNLISKPINNTQNINHNLIKTA